MPWDKRRRGSPRGTSTFVPSRRRKPWNRGTVVPNNYMHLGPLRVQQPRAEQDRPRQIALFESAPKRPFPASSARPPVAKSAETITAGFASGLIGSRSSSPQPCAVHISGWLKMTNQPCTHSPVGVLRS